MAIDNSAAYNNRAAVADFPKIVEGWQRDAAAYREMMAKDGRSELNIRFGPSERQYLDLFNAKETDAPVALFIHGGYWRAMSPKEHSHLARGLTGNGVTVAVAGYDLSPQVSIAQIIEEMRAAVLFLWKRFGKRIMVYGHSAGGHLTACMMATDWPSLDPTAPPDLVPAGYAVSGVFDLAGLINTDMNADFKLDEASARAASPLFWPAPTGRVLDIVVGADELPEFIRLSHVMADSWGAAGVQTRYEEVPGTHHFNVVAPLADPLSVMTSRVVELCELTRR
jgi:arylformamidase